MGKSKAALVGMLTALIPSCVNAPTQRTFGVQEIAYLDGEIEYNKFEEAIERHYNTINNCVRDAPGCPDAYNVWTDMVKELSQYERNEQLQKVNSMVNGAILNQDDSLAYNQRDYWASPLESLMKGGDCDDYALAKLLLLREVGWTADSLILYVVDDTTRQDALGNDMTHAVLVVSSGSQRMVLDNQVPEVRDETQVTRYVPHFGVNEVGFFRIMPDDPFEELLPPPVYTLSNF